MTILAVVNGNNAVLLTLGTTKRKTFFFVGNRKLFISQHTVKAFSVYKDILYFRYIKKINAGFDGLAPASR
ncbi:hypothetical protein [Desulfovibrio legallii]|uniref:hypothetical protein n=1 Tax=Desulfovibrio legallii TaxID=571438 RepID=UPI001178B605|nr:hypothetical protein [Desulfovibrio legallii]